METSTDAPWISAKHRYGHRDESVHVLFDEVQSTVVYRSRDYTLSLSSFLVLAFAILVAYVYRWLCSRREYTKVSDPRVTDSRDQMRYESA